MEIAVGVGCHDLLFFAEGEAGYGLRVGLQVGDAASFGGLQKDPVDVVHIRHGMDHFAYGDGHFAAVSYDHRHVLLVVIIGGLCGKELHVTAAAYGDDAGVFQHEDQVSTGVALVDLYFACVFHLRSPFFFVVNISIIRYASMKMAIAHMMSNRMGGVMEVA